MRQLNASAGGPQGAVVSRALATISTSADLLCVSKPDGLGPLLAATAAATQEACAAEAEPPMPHPVADPDPEPQPMRLALAAVEDRGHCACDRITAIGRVG